MGGMILGMNETRTAEQAPQVHDYVEYFGSLVDMHDTYAVTAVNADGSYELALIEGGQTVRLHTVRRSSIQWTGGRVDAHKYR
jgi:hypothetical protein